MTGEEYRAAVRDVVYLAACAVNGRTPDSTRVARMELPLVYEAADHHLLTGITAIALAGAGVQDDAFTQARGKAIRKVAAFDVERAAILAQLEQAGIWYMPLKGCILKELYPQLGMRQMADNDILYDASRRADVRSIMEGLGFNTEEIKHQSVHDHYFKPPVCNFEMHRKLFGANQGKLAVYYRDVKTRLLRTEGTEYGFHFRSDDFYVYMTAHEYKHYSGGGTGLRSLLDTYVYIGKKGAELDWDYIGGELEKLGIAGFEAQNRSLARHLFAGEALTAADEEMLNYILSSGTYGTVWNRVNNNLSAFGDRPQSRIRYVCSRVFLPLKSVKILFPLFYKHPLLLPFLPFYRVYRCVTVNKGKLRAELKALARYKK